jgi:uncharacterized membrane protein SpoIIM required for sporulation
MAAPTSLAPPLKSQRFRLEREADWIALDAHVRRIERHGAASLSDDELLSIPRLYRAALSSLSVARATSLDHELIAYLESLCARAYFLVYGARSTLLERLRRFFLEDWPVAARALWRETAAAWLLMALGAAVAYVLARQDPDWFYAFIPSDMAGGRDPTATTAFLRSTLYEPQKNGLSFFATFLFTHNAQIALIAFALGFAFCVPTAFLMIFNGAMVGAIFALYVPRGLGPQLGGWLFIHGTTELFAVALAGAAGFRIGWTLAFPGRRARIDAMTQAGRQGAMVMFGVVVMLFIAGLLEGLGRQLIRVDIARWSIAAVMLLGWSVYLYRPRRKGRARG